MTLPVPEMTDHELLILVLDRLEAHTRQDLKTQDRILEVLEGDGYMGMTARLARLEGNQGSRASTVGIGGAAGLVVAVIGGVLERLLSG